MTEVKTLIAALTTERNAIDRAIAGLQQMSEVRNGGAAPKAEKAKKPTRKHLTREQWMDVGSRLERGDSVKNVAQRFGIHVMTIYQWRRRTNTASNSNGAHAEPQPETNASAIGVQ